MLFYFYSVINHQFNRGNTMAGKKGVNPFAKKGAVPPPVPGKGKAAPKGKVPAGGKKSGKC